MSNLEEIKRRHWIIHDYIIGRTWDKNPEFLLIKQIVSGEIIQEYTEKYPYNYDYEWEVYDGYSNLGKGDLVLTDAHGNFLIIECKYINLNATGQTARSKRRKSRRDVKKQTKDYIKAFKIKNFEAKNVIGLAVTNEKIIFFQD